MKYQCNIILVLLVFKLSCFESTENLIHNVTGVEESLNEQISSNSVKTMNLCTLYDNLKSINNFLKPKYKRLFVIIADKMKDAITLAEILSDNNRSLPEKENHYSHIQQLLYNDTVENYYLYYNKDTSVHIFVYPRNLKNEILSTYLAKKTIESAESIKIALTCNEENNKDALNHMFEIAGKILRNVDLKLNNELRESIIFLPLTIRVKCGYLKAINNLEKYFYLKFAKFKDSPKSNDLFANLYSNSQNLDIQESIEYYLIEPILTMKLVFGMNELCEMDEVFTHSQRVLVWNYMSTNKTLIKFNLSLTENDETLKCFQSRILEMGNSILGPNLKMTLTGVFTFLNYLQSTYWNLTQLKDDTSFKDLCNCNEKLDIVKLFCHIRYMSDTSYKSQIWINSLQNFAEEYLKKKIVWYVKTKLVYDNANYLDESNILQQFHDLYEEIPEIWGNNEELIKSALIMIKNNTVNVEENFMCYRLKDGFYKMEFRGKFVKLSNILRKNYCEEKIKFLEIFALEKIIIDEDLIGIGEEMQINIIAPIWEIVFERIINLDGVSGSNGSSHGNLSNGKNGSFRKNDGLPGSPGGPGGIFFGIYDKIIEGENLQISSKGGKGGNGQNGRKGNGHLNPPGNGGLQGKGGIHGLIELFPLNNTHSNIQLSLNNGTEGYYGIGGIFLSSNDLLFGKSNFNTEGYQEPKKPTLLENFVESIKRYRKYIVSSNLNATTTDFYTKLNRNPNVLNKYKILDFIEDLNDLEGYYSMNMNKSTALLLLTAWREGIHQYYFDRKHENNDKLSKVILSLDTIVSRKIQKLEERFYYHSILMIDVYLEECIQESEKLENADILLEMRILSKKFKIDFETEIKKARKLVNDDVQVELEKRSGELSNSIREIVNEVNDIIKLKIDEKEKLKTKKEELKNKLILRSIFGCVQFILLAISFINPTCAIVGSILRVGAFVAESELLDKGDNSNSVEIKLPKGVLNSMERTFENYDRKKREAVLFVENKLDEMKAKQYELIKAGEDVQPLTDVATKMQQYFFTKSKTGKSNPMKRFRTVVQEVKQKWSKRNGLERKKVEKSLNFMSSSIEMDPENIVDLGKETYSKISSDLSEIEKVNEMLERVPNDIEKLEDFINRIYEHLEPQIQQIREKIKIKSAEFAISSITYLEFQKWHMDDYLSNVSMELKSWTENFKVEESVKIILKKMENAINTIIRLHTLIKEFNMKIKNAEYVEDMASAPFQITNIHDIKIRKPLTKLLHTHYANDIIDEYKKWIIAFKQYTFPFVNEFPDVSESLFAVFSDPVVKANFIVEKMKFLKSHLNKKKAHGQLFKHTTTSRFESRGPLSSFYTWKNRQHSSDIKDILEGKEVKLFANIFEKNNFSAIKFRNINILFVSDDPKYDIENDFKGFSVTLTHNGDSYYRCNDKVYLIESGAFEFGSQFFRTPKKRSVDFNKLDYVLSPYATWTVRLNRMESNFTKLAKYVNNVNIELVGDGQYMNSNVSVCENDFTEYYGKEIINK